MKTNPHDPVYDDLQPGEKWLHNHGPLTKREYFAAMAMQGVLANSSLNTSLADDGKIAVAAADALIAELNKPTDQDGEQNGR